MANESPPSSSGLIMLRPKHFAWNPDTASSNAFQGTMPSPSEAREIALEGLREFDQMAVALYDAGIPLTILEDRDEPACPDAVFLNNWFCTLPASTAEVPEAGDEQEPALGPGGGAGLVHFPMESPARRLEIRPNLAHELIESGFQVDFESDWSDWAEGGQYLEGTGSMVLDHQHRIAYAALSSRTSITLFRSWCSAFGFEPLSFETADRDGHPLYHTNVVMSLGRRLAFWGSEAVEIFARREVHRRLQDGGRLIIDLNLRQISEFGANVLEAYSSDGTPHWIASQRAITSWTSDQRRTIESCSSILAVDIPTIERIGGGSARCMLAENHLPPRLHTL
ncbi:MAG: arginine deiminase-related protein [Bacteroidota bacterium]